MRPRDLISYFAEDIIDLPVREARKRREFWHYCAKRYLIFHRITSDQPGEPPSHIETKENGEKVIISERVMSFPPFWLRWSESELVQLYRLTKPAPTKRSP